MAHDDAAAFEPLPRRRRMSDRLIDRLRFAAHWLEVGPDGDFEGEVSRFSLQYPDTVGWLVEEDLLRTGPPPPAELTDTALGACHRYLFADVLRDAGKIDPVVRPQLQTALRNIDTERFTDGATQDEVAAGLADAWRALAEVPAFDKADQRRAMNGAIGYQRTGDAVQMAVMSWLATRAGFTLTDLRPSEPAFAMAVEPIAGGDRLRRVFADTLRPLVRSSSDSPPDPHAASFPERTGTAAPGTATTDSPEEGNETRRPPGRRGTENDRGQESSGLNDS